MELKVRYEDSGYGDCSNLRQEASIGRWMSVRDSGKRDSAYFDQASAKIAICIPQANEASPAGN